VNQASSDNLDLAVQALREGQLVAFPTETVYGLGADASNAQAVRRIFEVKGRPSNHPLIVHLASAAALSDWTGHVPEAAQQLAEAFWPGPLTLVLPKSSRVPDATTGGLPSVALRVPAHPLALELLQRFGGGVAAPSANRFGRVSPTRAEHVHEDLGAEVSFVLDGGACSVGLESTILDLSSPTPVLLRPGGVTAEDIERVLGISISRVAPAGVRAPGMLHSHYAPQARVELVSSAELATRGQELLAHGQRVALLLLDASDEERAAIPEALLQLELGTSQEDAARLLYSALRQADAVGADVILATPPAQQGLGEALGDRLRKAAGPRS
jgi:L-threonylcarbamoyladenylate synthase